MGHRTAFEPHETGICIQCTVLSATLHCIALVHFQVFVFHRSSYFVFVEKWCEQDAGVEGDGYGAVRTAGVDVVCRERAGGVQPRPAERVHERCDGGHIPFGAVLRPTGRCNRLQLLLQDDAEQSQHPPNVHQECHPGSYEVRGQRKESQEPPVWNRPYSLKKELPSQDTRVVPWNIARLDFRSSKLS